MKKLQAIVCEKDLTVLLDGTLMTKKQFEKHITDTIAVYTKLGLSVRHAPALPGVCDESFYAIDEKFNVVWKVEVVSMDEAKSRVALKEEQEERVALRDDRRSKAEKRATKLRKKGLVEIVVETEIVIYDRRTVKVPIGDNTDNVFGYEDGAASKAIKKLEKKYGSDVNIHEMDFHFPS